MLLDKPRNNHRRQKFFSQRMKQCDSSQSPHNMKTAPSDETMHMRRIQSDETMYSQVRIENIRFCKDASERGNLTKIQIESPSANRSSKKKDWMKNRAKVARATISSPFSLQNATAEAKIHRTSHITGSHNDEINEATPVKKLFTFSPTAANNNNFNSQKQDDAVESITLYPSDETSILLVATMESQDNLDESRHILHSLTQKTSGGECTRYFEQTGNQNKTEVLPTFTIDTVSMSERTKIRDTNEAMSTFTTDTKSTSDEDRNDDIVNDSRYEDEDIHRDDYDALFVTLREHTIPSTPNIDRPAPSMCTSMKDQMVYDFEPEFVKSAHPKMIRAASTCSEEARLHSMLEKVSKESFERTMQSKWWDEESNTVSLLSPNNKDREPHQDIFETMTNTVSQFFEALGCNLSLCTETDDRIGNEIDINKIQQSVLEDDITLDLNTSVMTE